MVLRLDAPRVFQQDVNSMLRHVAWQKNRESAAQTANSVIHCPTGVSRVLCVPVQRYCDSQLTPFS